MSTPGHDKWPPTLENTARFPSLSCASIITPLLIPCSRAAIAAQLKGLAYLAPIGVARPELSFPAAENMTLPFFSAVCSRVKRKTPCISTNDLQSLDSGASEFIPKLLLQL